MIVRFAQFHLKATVATPWGHFQLEPDKRAPAGWSHRSHHFFASQRLAESTEGEAKSSAAALAPSSDGSTKSGSSRSLDTDLNDWAIWKNGVKPFERGGFTRLWDEIERWLKKVCNSWLGWVAQRLAILASRNSLRISHDMIHGCIYSELSVGLIKKVKLPASLEDVGFAF